MKLSVFSFAAVLLTVCATADDRLRDVQAQLKNQGFYFGEVDGNDGNETNAALRRYQIRNGLSVTGKLNDETLRALGMEVPKSANTPPKTAPGAKAPKAAQVNPPPVDAPTGTDEPPARTGRPRQDLLREPNSSEEPPVARHGQPYPDDPAVVAPPTRIPTPLDNEEYATFFHGTPYAHAPLEVQFDIVRKAQAQLARKGYYHGALNGLPATLMSDALFQYQTQQRLPRTGRLDLQTLAEFNLLPGRGTEAPAVRPFYDPNRRRDRSVDSQWLIR